MPEGDTAGLPQKVREQFRSREQLIATDPLAVRLEVAADLVRERRAAENHALAEGASL